MPLPTEFEAAGLTGRKLALLFDDLHQRALTSDPLKWMRRLLEATGEPPLVVCTSRDGSDWTRAREQPRLRMLLDQSGEEQVISMSVGGADLTEEEAMRSHSRSGF